MKYIFIDSNIYKYLYSRSEEFSDTIITLLEKIISIQDVKLLLPEQVKNEVERNRYCDWPEEDQKTLNNQCEHLKTLQAKITKEYTRFKSSAKLIIEIEKEIRQNEKIISTINSTCLNKRSKPNQILKKLFSKTTLIPESDEIMRKADIRVKKRNPPRDGEHYGDCIIWESLLSYFETIPKNTKSTLIFISNDGNAWGKIKFNKWLEEEFKTVTKHVLTYIQRLSDLPELTKDEQEQIRKQERIEEKITAIINFSNSTSWSQAGKNAKNLLEYKDIFNENDFESVIVNSSKNDQIYGSFYTDDPLTILLSGDEEGYVINAVEKINKEIWDTFVKKFNCKLVRHCDEEIGNTTTDYIDRSDIEQSISEEVPF